MREREIMSDRVIDTERAGGAVPVLDPHDEFPPAAPVSVEQACAAVDGWLESGMPLFGIHQSAVALRREVKQCLEDRQKAFEIANRYGNDCRSAKRQVSHMRSSLDG